MPMGFVEGAAHCWEVDGLDNVAEAEKALFELVEHGREAVAPWDEHECERLIIVHHRGFAISVIDELCRLDAKRG